MPDSHRGNPNSNCPAAVCKHEKFFSVDIGSVHSAMLDTVPRQWWALCELLFFDNILNLDMAEFFPEKSVGVEMDWSPRSEV